MDTEPSSEASDNHPRRHPDWTKLQTEQSDPPFLTHKLARQHLTHRLPWESLGEVVKAFNDGKGYYNNQTKLPTREQLRVIYYFAKCLSDAVKEFAESDTSTAEERFEYNPVENWGEYASCRGAAMGYYDSLIYSELNLILSDSEIFIPLVTGKNQR